MPHVYEESMPIEKMRETTKYHVCAICGGPLEIKYDLEKHQAFLTCRSILEHEGIAKEYQNREYNIETRREFMTTEIGEKKTQALEKYSGVSRLSKAEAREIIDTIWPAAGKASPAEVYKAVSICADYGLNPLMKHVYLIPFYNKDKKGYDYVTVLGIGANRLIASRKHSYSYIDDTPRLMTEDEQTKVFGEVQSNKLMAITILKDMKTGATARGYGNWPKDVDPKGTDKGNNKANMAFIRSERQALDRLYPADMPRNVEVIDENYEVTVEPPTQEAAPDGVAEEVRELPTVESTPEATESPTSPDVPPEPAKATQPKETKLKGKASRDPATIKTKGQFQAACHEDFGLNSPADILAALRKDCPEVTYNTMMDITDYGEAYQMIAKAREV